MHWNGTKIYESFYELSMNLSKAFDVIQHDLLLAKLKHMDFAKEVAPYLRTTCQEDGSE